MKSSRSAPWVLILLTITAGSGSAPPVVKVELHDPALLPCSERCSGVVRWSRFSNADDVLAECDRTSCRSVKEGYQMIHEDYLKGNLSLSISGADFRKRALYVCDCDGRDFCDVRLQIEALKTTVQKKVGESLILELDVSDPLEVVYNSSGAAGPSSVQICKLGRRSVQFEGEYVHRLILSPALELKEMKVSDSGVYTVRDTFNDEVIHIYTVSVSGDSEAQDQIQKPSGPSSPPPGNQLVWVSVSVAPFVILWVMMMIVLVWRKIQKRPENRDHEKNNIPMADLGHSSGGEQEKLTSTTFNPFCRAALYSGKR